MCAHDTFMSKRVHMLVEMSNEKTLDNIAGCAGVNTVQCQSVGEFRNFFAGIFWGSLRLPPCTPRMIFAVLYGGIGSYRCCSIWRGL